MMSGKYPGNSELDHGCWLPTMKTAGLLSEHFQGPGQVVLVLGYLFQGSELSEVTCI